MTFNPSKISKSDVLYTTFNKLANYSPVNNDPKLPEFQILFDEYVDFLGDSDITTVELYSQILEESLIMKASITSASKTSYCYEISTFRINNDETIEAVVLTDHLRDKNPNRLFKKIFTETKCFLPFNKYDIDGEQVMDKDSTLYKVLADHYKYNKPTELK
jgi:hypothetical protein